MMSRLSGHQRLFVANRIAPVLHFERPDLSRFGIACASFQASSPIQLPPSWAPLTGLTVPKACLWRILKGDGDVDPRPDADDAVDVQASPPCL